MLSKLKVQFTTFPNKGKVADILAGAYVMMMLLLGGIAMFSGEFDSGFWQVMAGFFWGMWYFESKLVHSAHDLVREVLEGWGKSEELSRRAIKLIGELNEENEQLKSK